MSLANRILLAPALLLCAAVSLPAHAQAGDKVVSCSSSGGDRSECAADLRGYSLADIKQQSRAICEVGRNFGYDDRGVWVDGGCRGSFTFRDTGSQRDDARSYGYTEPGIPGEKRVKCESQGGMREECSTDLRGYRFVEVRSLSRADCVVGRNFGYDDRGVWTDDGCRGEFVFMDERNASRRSEDRYPVAGSTSSVPGIVRCESQDGRTVVCPADGAERVRLSRQLSRTECVEGKNWGVNRDGIWVDDGCRGDFEVQTRLSSSR